ncbi:MAG: hypothetical protein [Circular genetic element sp.]|nr:MAG: hypothetical protein [Circular genetic element sp.]
MRFDSIRDPDPSRGVFGGAPSLSNKPSRESFVNTSMYYAWNYGPAGLLDPGNPFEAKQWSRSVGWGAGILITLSRGIGVPILYGMIGDPDHVYQGGLDDSYLGISDDRRRHGGSPFSHSSHFGSAQAWSPSSRSV